MGDRKGILTKDQEKVIAGFLDEKIKFKNALIEGVDGVIFGSIVTLVDDYGIEQLSSIYKEPLSIMADALLEKDWADAIEQAGIILDTAIDIPNVTDTKEAFLFQSTTQYIANLVFMFATEEQEAEEIEE